MHLIYTWAVEPFLVFFKSIAIAKQFERDCAELKRLTRSNQELRMLQARPEYTKKRSLLRKDARLAVELALTVSVSLADAAEKVKQAMTNFGSSLKEVSQAAVKAGSDFRRELSNASEQTRKDIAKGLVFASQPIDLSQTRPKLMMTCSVCEDQYVGNPFSNEPSICPSCIEQYNTSVPFRMVERFDFFVPPSEDSLRMLIEIPQPYWNEYGLLSRPLKIVTTA